MAGSIEMPLRTTLVSRKDSGFIDLMGIKHIYFYTRNTSNIKIHLIPRLFWHVNKCIKF